MSSAWYLAGELDGPGSKDPPCEGGKHSHPWDDNGTRRCGMCGRPMRKTKKEKIAMSDRYDEVRKPEHSTVGDAIKNRRRNITAFENGAQYALDMLLARTTPGLQALSNGKPAMHDLRLSEYVEFEAASVLERVHSGDL